MLLIAMSVGGDVLQYTGQAQVHAPAIIARKGMIKQQKQTKKHIPEPHGTNLK